MYDRLLIGLSVGSGCEAVCAAAVRAEGVSLNMAPRVVSSTRVLLSTEVRTAGRRLLHTREAWPTGLVADLADACAAAAHRVVDDVGLRSVLAIGVLTRLPDADPCPDRPTASLADRLAEATGVTIVSEFAGRDVAAGGTGRLLTPASDFLLFASPLEDRVLLHLGSVCVVVGVPAGGKLSDVAAVVSGPGNQFLDDMIALGTHGRQTFDPGGTKAVQGRCREDLLADWASRPGSKPTSLAEAFDAVRSTGGTLHDLLCTATHHIARCAGRESSRVLPTERLPRRVLVSGGGARNGFLWKLLVDQFSGCPVERTDVAGVPAEARTAADAAVLTGLTLDGVSANLPLVTGAVGGRLVGRFTPGDPRNWAACTAWMAEQLSPYASLRAA